MKQDNKTVSLTIYFFTNNLPHKEGKDMDKIPFWPNGSIHLKANRTKGLKSQEAIFNSMEDIQSVIELVLKRGNLVVTKNSKSKKELIY
jgi:hypothetical protein